MKWGRLLTDPSVHPLPCGIEKPHEILVSRSRILRLQPEAWILIHLDPDLSGKTRYPQHVVAELVHQTIRPVRVDVILRLLQLEIESLPNDLDCVDLRHPTIAYFAHAIRELIDFLHG